MPGWSFTEYVLLAFTLPLLVCSAFFSGSETALFGLSESEKLQLRRRSTIGSRAVHALLEHPRMLLITVLAGNMTVNTLYFVISSVLIMHADVGVTAGIAMAAGVLIVIVLFGEVLPKLYANAHRITFSLACAPPLLAIHRASTLIRLLVDSIVVTPLSRLTAPSAAPPRLDAAELAELLDVTRDQGVIDLDEQIVMRDVIRMGRTRVHEIMTPRVHMPAVSADASRDKAIALLRRRREPLVPLYDGSLDTIVGVLDAMALLREEGVALEGGIGPRRRKAQARENKLPAQAILRPEFVPEVATVDRLLLFLRQRGARAAIVVDEYGGTSGFVTIDHVINQIAAEHQPDDEQLDAAHEGGAS
jgi:CBS domain containing-hemolysin-like protein